MRGRRKNRVSSFFEGFNAGYDTADKVIEDVQLGDAMREKPEVSTGFTEAQGNELRAAAESGQYDVTFNRDTGQYEVTPKGGGQTGKIAPVTKTTMYGRTVEGEMTPEQVGSARMQAMAGVYDRTGKPQKAMQLRQQARQGELQDLQIKQAQRNERQAASEEQFKAEVAEWQKNSRWGETQQANMEAERNFQSAMADYQAKLNSDADPRTLQKPQPPQKAAYGVGDSLHDTSSFLALESKYGKFEPQKWISVAEKLDKVQGEGYERALRAAEGGAPLDKVAAEFNKSGDVRLDPKSVVSDTVGKTNIRGQQVDSRIITYKDDKGRLHTINVAAELAGIGGTKDILTTHFQLKEDKRSDQRLGMEGARLGIAQSEAGERRTARDEDKRDKKAREEAAIAIFKQQNPNATGAEIEAVRTGIVPAVKKEATNEFTTTTDSMGLNVTRTNKNTGQVDIINPKSGEVRTIASSGRPSSAAPAGGIPPVDQRQIGQVYDTPRGKMIWRGQGWEPVSKK